MCRMEETVRSLLQNPGVLEQTAVDIMKAYKVSCCPPKIRSNRVPHVTKVRNEVEVNIFKSAELFLDNIELCSALGNIG